ncbi:PRC-barrel domain-containing protein [archaeon]|nr:PRC-barrel domain-containing protein [archaeon]
MTLRASRLYGLDIYDTEGGYIGKVNDLVLNLEKGEIIRITTEPLRATLTKDELPDILQKKSLLYRRVASAKDILIVNKS